MRVEVRVPALGLEEDEEVRVGAWLARAGNRVQAEADLVELLAGKASYVLPAPASGTLSEVRAAEDARVAEGEVLGAVETE